MDIFHFDYDFQENSQGAGNDLQLLEEKWLGDSFSWLFGRITNARLAYFSGFCFKRNTFKIRD